MSGGDGIFDDIAVNAVHGSAIGGGDIFITGEAVIRNIIGGRRTIDSGGSCSAIHDTDHDGTSIGADIGDAIFVV